MNRIAILFLIIAFIIACTKADDFDNNIENGKHYLDFISLTAEKDSLRFGESTTITAVVSASSKVYYECYSPGTIVRSGSRVTFIPTCAICGGVNRITCRASAGKFSEAKYVYIYVY